MIRYLMIFALIFTCGCGKKHVEEKIADDFESLMGKDLSAWEYVRTKEDFRNIAFFKQVYESNIAHLKEVEEETKIPHVIHFIWIGPKAFPRESIENVRTWIAHHPDWIVKFWTDRERALPHPKMQRCMVSDLNFQKLRSFYNSSDNFGEKSDLLRLEILYQEGGIYVDHDVKCLNRFDPLNSAFDFYCGMEVPYPTSLSSSVMPTNNLLGARTGHCVLEKCMDWLVEHWEQIEQDYPGTDRDSVINRVTHRTFSSLGINFKQFANQEENIDIALPTYYFNSPKEEQALFAQHQYKGTWFENESDFEKNARKRLMMLSKKTNKLLLALGILAGLNLIGFSLLAFMIHKKRVV